MIIESFIAIENKKFPDDISVVLDIIEKSNEYGRPYHEYFSLNGKLDYSTTEVKEFTYCLMVNLEDTSARWVSREWLVARVGEDVVLFGENAVKNALSNVLETIRISKHHPAYPIMREIVDSLVRHYRSDFDFGDSLWLGLNPDKNFVWSVRDMGSDIFGHVNGYMNALAHDGDKTRKWYGWDGVTLEEFTNDILGEIDRLFS